MSHPTYGIGVNIFIRKIIIDMTYPFYTNKFYSKYFVPFLIYIEQIFNKSLHSGYKVSRWIDE